MNIVRHIPNTITSMNLLCGSIGVILASDGMAGAAFLLMLAAAVCDFFDGLSARLLNAYSAVGKELDSLADLVSFGLLPAMMLREGVLHAGLTGIWTFVPVLLVVFSALRLAKFNTDDSQTENFRGLATPACAMITGSFVYYIFSCPDSFMVSWLSSRVFVCVATALLCALMVSPIPMFSMKFKKAGKADTPIYKMRIAFVGVFCVCTVLVALLGLNWSMIILLTFVTYVLMNLINALIGR